MDEPEDKPPVSGTDGALGDDYFLTAHQRLDGDDVPQLETHDDDDADANEQGEDEADNDEPVEPQCFPVQGTGSVQVTQEMQTEGSELGSVDASSVDALPRRAGSPIESVLSGPDDTPSVQVRLRLWMGVTASL
jgi:vacuolar protein sorting-associated protein 8